MNRSLAPCGTPAAYRRHLRGGEPTCTTCRAAHAAAIAGRERRPLATVRQLKPCGSQAAYERHLRRREVACTPCCRAHAIEVARYATKRRTA
jgi:hypothetical protein